MGGYTWIFTLMGGGNGYRLAYQLLIINSKTKRSWTNMSYDDEHRELVEWCKKIL